MKLSALTIILLGLSISIIALGLGLLGFGDTLHGFMYNKKEEEFQNGYIQQLEGEIAKRPAAEKRVRDAKALVETEGQKWEEIVATKTPPQGIINLDVNAWQLVVDSRRFRNNVQRDINRQVKVGGVRVVNGPYVPDPSDDAKTIVQNYFNYPAMKFPVCIWDFGTITVQGSFEQILTNMQSWAAMPNYLAVASGLQISGTSPALTGTYQLTVLAFIKADRIFPKVPENVAVSTTPAPGQNPAPGPGNTNPGGQNPGGPRPGGPPPGGPGGGNSKSGDPNDQ